MHWLFYELKLPGTDEINLAALVPVISIRVRQLIQVIGILVDIVAVLVFRLCVLIVTFCAVVYCLQKGRLILLHHIGGRAAGRQDRKSLTQVVWMMVKLEIMAGTVKRFTS